MHFNEIRMKLSNKMVNSHNDVDQADIIDKDIRHIS